MCLAPQPLVGLRGEVNSCPGRAGFLRTAQRAKTEKKPKKDQAFTLLTAQTSGSTCTGSSLKTQQNNYSRDGNVARLPGAVFKIKLLKRQEAVKGLRHRLVAAAWPFKSQL